MKQPEELTSTLFQIDATLYSLQRMQQSIEEQISYCSQYPVFANYWADIDFLETYFIRGNPEDEEELSLNHLDISTVEESRTLDNNMGDLMAPMEYKEL